MSAENVTIAGELERLAVGVGDVAEVPLAILRHAAEALRRRPDIEVVEQGALLRAPDGWSWDDVGPLTGYWSGIRLQRGEPILEQDGHFLLFRQGETSYTKRQESIYRALSGVETYDENDRPRHPATVLVVHGFKGARTGYTLFEFGNQRATRVLAEGELLEWVENWLRNAHDDPIRKRVIPPRGPRKERFDDAA